ncbi:MAG: DNA-binding protein [Gammaproteobacteria bacterium]|nr:DNA-binding protein [Gammaproteobacteria bacterium]
MKTLSLQVDDNLYEALIALLKQLPENKVRILKEPPVKMDFEQAGGYVLKKNAELYKRLA